MFYFYTLRNKRNIGLKLVKVNKKSIPKSKVFLATLEYTELVRKIKICCISYELECNFFVE